MGHRRNNRILNPVKIPCEGISSSEMDVHALSRPSVTMSMPMFHQPLTGIDRPHANDVLCGRGVTTNRHAGNESFRRLVGLNKV
jgi:hypothetical protein